jgi:hypothetical protein
MTLKNDRKLKRSVKSQLDVVFAKYIRSSGRCRRCGSVNHLQCSHIYSRANLAVRWDKDNAICLCAGCHWWWHKNPVDAIDWLKSTLSPELLENLKKKSNMVKKWSLAEMQNTLKNMKILIE